MSENPKRVAVIGAGVAGLSVLRNLTDTSKNYIPTCFERGSDIGGVWVYNKNTHIDENGMPVFTSMYRDLMTNIPKQLMAFPDFSYQPGPSYISRPDVCDYLQRYADKYDLRQHIKMNTFVQTVRPNGKERDTKWTVSYFDVRKKDEVHKEVFDNVIVCSGHHEKPYSPEVDGLDKFKGEVLHSHNYRIPEYFKDKKVVILGASFSGQDLAVGISRYGKKVFLSHVKDPLLTVLPAKVVEKPGIKHMTESGVVFLDDTNEEVDVLLFCTGYRTHFPFLSKDVLQINCQRVTPVYKHIVHIKFPTLFFVGIPKLLSYFPQSFEIAKAIVAILNGTVILPSEDQMSDDAENDFAQRKKEGLDDSQAHFMGDGDRQWRFNKDIAKMAGLDPLPTSFQRLWDYVIVQRDHHFLTFRKQNFDIIDSDKIVEVQ
ncbi:dimethylaniline monooxygenase [N-oxide-forming] 1-like isoform X2 [Mizuhopecten yessoensis]|uniref:Flavin-containing monooxygenase n=2 Tax=Mizuhopecten yessoensis TaxID=6573 RepID=A0A210PK24_MIZYE|nr:dimethylaniline monooxygenase [N-oxide-forming] 1-like isoform X2 [Mizuhopecten yessoensis]OWF36756.1 Flavin-containing monooxygenase FMO GS-OX-like 3 [Mizuhopecten yessoensis]